MILLALNQCFMDIQHITTAHLFSTSLQESVLPTLLRKHFLACQFPWQVLAGFGDVLAEMIALRHTKIQGEVSDRAELIGEDIVIEKGACVEGFVSIRSPAYISSGAVVRSGAYLRGGVYMAPKALMGHSCEAKSSLLLEGAKASHHVYLGDSLLGYGVNLGAGTKTANVRLDKKPVCLKINNDTIFESGMRKLGAICADYSQTGCNVVTNPGVILTRSAKVLPLKAVSGVV
ncbi:MAG: hypothetical protein OXC44_04400 [Proteobacteria bacterium]|nr:hypothetical protein [Pseudomonadota bacterium]